MYYANLDQIFDPVNGLWQIVIILTMDTLGTQCLFLYGIYKGTFRLSFVERFVLFQSVRGSTVEKIREVFLFQLVSYYTLAYPH